MNIVNVRLPADAASMAQMEKGAIDDLRKHLEGTNEEDVFKAVLDAITKSPQFNMAQYPERAFFLRNITKEGAVRQTLSRFVAGLCIEYDSILVEVSKFPISTKYCALQTQWMQRIREIVQSGERLARSKEQNPDDEEESELPSCVAFLALEAFGDDTAQTSTLFAVMHTVARQVFMYQQSTAVRKKLSVQEGPEEIDIFSEESEDALYRVCGAQIHRMITVRGKKTSDNKQTRHELDFLRKISMTNDEKMNSLPISLLGTEQGGRIFPKPELLPFIQLVIGKVKEEVNDTAFKRFGVNLFKVICVLYRPKILVFFNKPLRQYKIKFAPIFSAILVEKIKYTCDC